MDNKNQQEGEGRFYPDQTVICIDGWPKTGFTLNGLYKVSSYEYKMNPVNGLWFWYIGIEGRHNWIRPSIFAPLQEFKPITLIKILEKETELVSVN